MIGSLKSPTYFRRRRPRPVGPVCINHPDQPLEEKATDYFKCPLCEVAFDVTPDEATPKQERA